MNGARLRRGLALLVIVAGLGTLGSGGWIHAKAQLAQLLLAGAWAATLAGAGNVRPWPWADGYPIARLRVRSGADDLVVLAGASGRNLAFAPGLLDGSGVPGQGGTPVISGHRDTHFRFLQSLQAGDVLALQDRTGRWREYRVERSEVADIRRDRLPLAAEDGLLLLVTCYPFDALLPGGPLRYLVGAREVM